MNKNVPTEMVNRTILEALANDNVKTAADAATDYTRIQLREDSFAFKILPPEQITPDNLDRDIDERNRVICELEPDSPGSKWCPLQDVPEGEYSIHAVVVGSMISTRFTSGSRRSRRRWSPAPRWPLTRMESKR